MADDVEAEKELTKRGLPATQRNLVQFSLAGWFLLGSVPLSAGAVMFSPVHVDHVETFAESYPRYALIFLLPMAVPLCLALLSRPWFPAFAAGLTARFALIGAPCLMFLGIMTIFRIMGLK